jgi:hypothetical protein
MAINDTGWWGKLHAEKAQNDQNSLMNQKGLISQNRQLDQIGQMSPIKKGSPDQ